MASAAQPVGVVVKSLKLSITCRKALEEKYDVRALARIEKAIAGWVAADKVRGLTTVHIAIDDATEMKRYGVSPIKGQVTAVKVKAALDSLVTKLSPDYIVLIGATDVVPSFEVPNPTLNASGDTDPNVPTDNPYASSKAFSANKRASYLIPDRVLGRIPDLFGSHDPAWLINCLRAASKGKPRSPKAYLKDLLVCCEAWKKSGQECAKYIARDAATLLISPPARDSSATLKARHGTLLQMFKCHGVQNDARFWGEGRTGFTEVLNSKSLTKRTKQGTVVAAVCCFGASVFDPLHPTALSPGDAPIPSVYLRQGAFAFFGSTNTAWVGAETMLCADWIVASFLKSVLAGASTGRAALETKQDFVRWSQQQGDEMDSGEEKTLIQFVLLGDPSIHPVVAREPATAGSAPLLSGSRTTAGLMARKQRRATRHQMGVTLRLSLPTRSVTKTSAVPSSVKKLAQKLAERSGDSFAFKLASPKVQSVLSNVHVPELSKKASVSRASAGVPRMKSATLGRRTYQYYWAARRDRGEVPEIRMMVVQTDTQGNALRTHVLVSS